MRGDSRPTRARGQASRSSPGREALRGESVPQSQSPLPDALTPNSWELSQFKGVQHSARSLHAWVLHGPAHTAQDTATDTLRDTKHAFNHLVRKIYSKVKIA